MGGMAEDIFKYACPDSASENESNLFLFFKLIF